MGVGPCLPTPVPLGPRQYQSQPQNDSDHVCWKVDKLYEQHRGQYAQEYEPKAASFVHRQGFRAFRVVV